MTISALTMRKKTSRSQVRAISLASCIAHSLIVCTEWSSRCRTTICSDSGNWDSGAPTTHSPPTSHSLLNCTSSLNTSINLCPVSVPWMSNSRESFARKERKWKRHLKNKKNSSFLSLYHVAWRKRNNFSDKNCLKSQRIIKRNGRFFIIVIIILKKKIPRRRNFSICTRTRLCKPVGIVGPSRSGLRDTRERRKVPEVPVWPKRELKFYGFWKIYATHGFILRAKKRRGNFYFDAEEQKMHNWWLFSKNGDFARGRLKKNYWSGKCPFCWPKQ